MWAFGPNCGVDDLEAVLDAIGRIDPSAARIAPAASRDEQFEGTVAAYLADMAKYQPQGTIDQESETSWAAMMLFAKVMKGQTNFSASHVLSLMKNISTPINLGVAGPYVVIAAQSTTQAKYWNNPFGWREIIDAELEAGRIVLWNGRLAVVSAEDAEARAAALAHVDNRTPMALEPRAEPIWTIGPSRPTDEPLPMATADAVSNPVATAPSPSTGLSAL